MATETPKPDGKMSMPRKWGIAHTATAGGVMTLGSFIAFHQFVYPRTEAQALVTRVEQQQVRIDKVEDKLDHKIEILDNKLDGIQSDMRRLIELQKR